MVITREYVSVALEAKGLECVNDTERYPFTMFYTHEIMQMELMEMDFIHLNLSLPLSTITGRDTAGNDPHLCNNLAVDISDVIDADKFHSLWSFYGLTPLIQQNYLSDEKKRNDTKNFLHLQGYLIYLK
eukprot:390861_1